MIHDTRNMKQDTRNKIQDTRSTATMNIAGNNQATSSQLSHNHKPRSTWNKEAANLKLQEEIRTKHGKVIEFSINDPRYPPQTVYCTPYQGDSSDETIREMIAMILEDGVSIPGTTTQIIGFDIEWCHDFRAKKPKPISLIQICGRSISLIIQLAHLQPPNWYHNVLPSPIGEFLRDRSVIKLGVGIKGDARKFECDRFSDTQRHKVYLDAYVDIHELARLVDPTIIDEFPKQSLSLQRLVARYLHQYMHKSKNLILSNWESLQLSRAQITYAASDVISAMRVFLQLSQMPAYRDGLIPIQYTNPSNI